MEARRLWFASPLLVLILAGCVGPEPKDASTAPSVTVYNTAAVVKAPRTVDEVATLPHVESVLAEPDRDARDRALDARYQAADVLSFFALKPGARVAELAAAGGYFTELLARDVGPEGRVFANEPPSLVRDPAVTGALADRLVKPVNADVDRTALDLASPLPAGATDLDLVYLSLPYRTAIARGVDTNAMDRAVLAALRPGGRFVVLDYRPVASGPTGTNLHAVRAQEVERVRSQIEEAGFRFVAEGRFLHDDPRPGEWDSIASAPEQTTPLEVDDRWMLEFVKPR